MKEREIPELRWRYVRNDKSRMLRYVRNDKSRMLRYVRNDKSRMLRYVRELQIPPAHFIISPVS